MKIYLAGPLFTEAERRFNLALATDLRDYGIEVFLPQEQEQRETTAMRIFQNDLAGLEECEVVVANMDGADPDSGTCWECGWAFEKKPIVLYRTDIRTEAPPFGPYNLMLHQSADIVLDCAGQDIDMIGARIEAALKDL